MRRLCVYLPQRFARDFRIRADYERQKKRDDVDNSFFFINVLTRYLFNRITKQNLSFRAQLNITKVNKVRYKMRGERSYMVHRDNNV